MVVLELGSHLCEDTKRIYDMIQPNKMICVDPIPEHLYQARAQLGRDGLLDKVTLIHAAIGNVNGVTPIYEAGASSSILRPTGHLVRFPLINFAKRRMAPVVTLDHLCEVLGIESVDFIHMDVQGAEHLVFQGGQKILETVDYINTEYYDEPMYEGQLPLDELIKLLPGHWEIVKRLENDAVLENIK